MGLTSILPMWATHCSYSVHQYYQYIFVFCAHLHVLFFQKNQIIGKFSVTLFYGFDHDFTYVGDTL